MQPIVFHLVQYLMVVQATRYVDIYIYIYDSKIKQKTSYKIYKNIKDLLEIA